MHPISMLIKVFSLSLVAVMPLAAQAQGISKGTAPGMRGAGRYREDIPQRAKGTAPGLRGSNRLPDSRPPQPPPPPKPREYLVPTEISPWTTPPERIPTRGTQVEYEPQVVLNDKAFSGAVIRGLRFSPDSSQLAVAGDVVRIYDVVNNKPLHTLRGQREFGGIGQCSDVAYSPDGKHLVVAVTGFAPYLRVYATDDYSRIADTLSGHSSDVEKIAFSVKAEPAAERGHPIMATAGLDNHIHLWEWDTRRKIKSYQMPELVTYLGFPCTCGNLLAIGESGKAYYWNIAEGGQTSEWHRETLSSCYNKLFSTFGGSFVHQVFDTNFGQQQLSVFAYTDAKSQADRYLCRVWNRETSSLLGSVSHRYLVKACVLSPNNQLVASADALGDVYVWSAVDGAMIAKFDSAEKGIFSVDFAGDRKLVFGRSNYPAGNGWRFNHYAPLNETFDFAAKIADRQNGYEPIRYTESGDLSITHDEYYNLSLWRRGRAYLTLPYGSSNASNPTSYRILQGNKIGFDNAVVIGYQNGDVVAFDPQNMLQKRTFLGHSDRVWSIAESPDGRFIATTSGDNTIRVWSLSSERRLGNIAAFTNRDGSVYHLVPRTPTAERLRVGDQLETIDGTPLSTLAEQFSARGDWPFKPEQVVSVGVARQGRRQVVAVPLSDIGDVVEPLLNFKISADQAEWIAWTPQGYYDSSPQGDQLIGWQINDGREKAARYCTADQFKAKLYRPDIIAAIWDHGSVSQAETVANQQFTRPPQPVDIRTAGKKFVPPVVTILSPSPGSTHDTNEVEVVAEVSSPSGEQILSVTMTVRGRRYPERNLEPTSADSKTRFTRKVLLDPGENIIEVVARTALSQGVDTRQVFRSRPATTLPVLHVLSVGVSKHKNDRLDLQFAAKDAIDFAEAMRQQAKRKRFADVRVSVLTDAGATRTEIERALEALIKQVKDDDVALVFLAGHGVTTAENDDYYFATHEADLDSPLPTCLNWATLQLVAERMRCQVVFFVDTCRSGGALGGRKVFRDPYRSLTDSQLRTILFAASRATDPAYEENGNGLFTRALLDILNDPRSIWNANGDDVLSANELAQGLENHVKVLSANKQTTASGIKGVGPDIPLFGLPTP